MKQTTQYKLYLQKGELFVSIDNNIQMHQELIQCSSKIMKEQNFKIRNNLVKISK